MTKWKVLWRLETAQAEAIGPPIFQRLYLEKSDR